MIQTWYYYNQTGWTEDTTMEVRAVLPEAKDQTVGDWEAEGSIIS